MHLPRENEDEDEKLSDRKNYVRLGSHSIAFSSYT